MFLCLVVWKNSLFCPFFSQIYLISCNIFFSFFSYFSSIFFRKNEKIFFSEKKKKKIFLGMSTQSNMNRATKEQKTCIFQHFGHFCDLFKLSWGELFDNFLVPFHLIWFPTYIRKGFSQNWHSQVISMDPKIPNVCM